MVSNSCIYYLIFEHPIHLRRLESSLRLLSKNFLNNFPYTIVFGHEGVSKNTRQLIKKSLPSDIKYYFKEVDFNLPNYPKSILDQIPEKFRWDGMWDENAFFSMGYRHMCRLFSGGMYLDDFFEKTNYLMRLDCDSYILNEIKNDPFQVMKDKQAVYGYVGEFIDDDKVIDGLSDFCEKIAPASKTIEYNKAYETNFFIEDCKWFRSNVWMDFFKAIDDSGNIFIKRWGDAPIKYQGINRLASEDKVIKIDIPYHHGGDYHEGLKK
tara:strand:- start:156 stop:953 length:798 start_codon:yes stop_codon:yes gene_type:complete